MSNIQTVEQELISKLTNWLPEYTIFTEWEEEGLPAKYGIQIALNYSTQPETTEQKVKVAYQATIYIYREYSESYGQSTEATEKEQLRTDMETIFNKQSIRIPSGQDITIFNSRNQKQKVKATFFNIIYE